MNREFKNFWEYFIPGAISWIAVMIGVALCIGFANVDWLRWFLITPCLLLIPALFASLVSGETFEQREQREMDEMDKRIADLLKAKGENK